MRASNVTREITVSHVGYRPTACRQGSLLLSRWKHPAPTQRGILNRLFQLNRRVFKAGPEVRFGFVEAINGNIRMFINRGLGYKNIRSLLLKVKRMAVSQHPIRRFSPNQKGRVERRSLRILAQSPFLS